MLNGADGLQTHQVHFSQFSYMILLWLTAAGLIWLKEYKCQTASLFVWEESVAARCHAVIMRNAVMNHTDLRCHKHNFR